MDTDLQIRLESWIIQDGNYGDFEIGPAEFALEFWPEHIEPTSDGLGPSLHHLRAGQYSAQGRVGTVTPAAWVVDFGAVSAYQDSDPPPWAKEGACFQGTVILGVDPFFYFESLADSPSMPELIYPWQITRIQLDTTPWISETAPGGPALFRRDATRESLRDIPRTNASSDDPRGGYLLTARLVGPPTRRFTRT